MSIAPFAKALQQGYKRYELYSCLQRTKSAFHRSPVNTQLPTTCSFKDVKFKTFCLVGLNNLDLIDFRLIVM